MTSRMLQSAVKESLGRWRRFAQDEMAPCSGVVNIVYILYVVYIVYIAYIVCIVHIVYTLCFYIHCTFTCSGTTTAITQDFNELPWTNT